MGIQFDSAPAPVHFVRRVPGPVRHLNATEQLGGALHLHWEPPGGMTRIEGYRVERTRDGHDYEHLGDTVARQFTITNPVPGEPWFYRVTAFNVRGVGRAKRVFFHRRARRLRPRGPILRAMLLPIPVIPGRRVGISELVPEP
jgi:hypothetical protein